MTRPNIPEYVRRTPQVRAVVLELLIEKGPMTHDQLIAEYHMRAVLDPDTPRASESGIRTRLSELRRENLVRRHGEDGASNFGNKAKMWIAVDPDAPVQVADPGDVTITDEDIVAISSGDTE